MRHLNRPADQIRPIEIIRNFTKKAAGAVYIKAGSTTVLCTASVEDKLPPWKDPLKEPSGWVTAEYSMLPGSTAPRKSRERLKTDSRSTEIQRLIGRSLRAAVDAKALGPRTITIDCDVLEADGGTRTLSITGGFIALVDALQSIQARDPAFSAKAAIAQGIAAVSLGYVKGELLLDLDYSEDSTAEVDLNVVMTSDDAFVEIQGTAEGKAFTLEQLQAQLEMARMGVRQLLSLQQKSLGNLWPLDKNFLIS